MTFAAFLLTVLAEQREPGQAMVEKDVILPRVFVVTVRARYSQRAVMGVVFFVAGQAVSGQGHIENRLDVASLAFSLGMRATEGVSGVCGVIELHIRPSGAHMTGLALRAEMSLVVVVFLVTADTLHGELV